MLNRRIIYCPTSGVLSGEIVSAGAACETDSTTIKLLPSAEAGIALMHIVINGSYSGSRELLFKKKVYYEINQ
jgi:hypothetical protein